MSVGGYGTWRRGLIGLAIDAAHNRSIYVHLGHVV